MKIKMSKALRSKIEARQETDEYWMDSAKLDFALALERSLREAGKSYGDLAASMQTSPAYISKIFRGDANLTIESMVKLSRNLGCHLHITLDPINRKDESVWAPFNKQKAASHRGDKAFDAFFKRDEGCGQIGEFHPDVGKQSSNDQVYQYAA